jgi:hypothetical protein
MVGRLCCCSPSSKSSMGVSEVERLTQAVTRGRQIAEAKSIQAYVEQPKRTAQRSSQVHSDTRQEGSAFSEFTLSTLHTEGIKLCCRRVETHFRRDYVFDGR